MTDEQPCQLRYYIPLAAPPTRIQADGTEPFLRPEVGFTPRWFREYCGLDFGEAWHRNPDLRMSGWEKMCAEIRRRFPGCNIGGCGAGSPPDLFTWTFGGNIVSSLYGQGIQFWPDNWPASTAERQLRDAEADLLEPPDLDQSPMRFCKNCGSFGALRFGIAQR
jgi:hypothetical protein